MPGRQQTETCYAAVKERTWAARQNPDAAHRLVLIALELYEQDMVYWARPGNELRLHERIKAEFARQHKRKYGFVWWVVLLQIVVPLIINAIIEWLRNREEHARRVADQARRVT